MSIGRYNGEVFLPSSGEHFLGINSQDDLEYPDLTESWGFRLSANDWGWVTENESMTQFSTENPLVTSITKTEPVIPSLTEDPPAIAMEVEGNRANPKDTRILEDSKTPESQARGRSFCPVCNKSFTRIGDMNRHQEKHQASSRVFQCSIASCNYSTYRKDHLQRHCRRIHKNQITHFTPKRVVDVPSRCETSTHETVSTDSKEHLRLFSDKSDVQLDSSTSPKLNDVSEQGTPGESTSRAERLELKMLQDPSIRCDSDKDEGLQSSRQHSLAEAWSEEESTAGTDTLSMDGGPRLALVYAKHQMIVRIMRDVYAMLAIKAQTTVQNSPSPKSNSSGGQAQHSKPPESGIQPTRRGVKRQEPERDSSPPNDRDDKRRKDNSAGSTLEDQSRLFACPFHKFDPHRYCPNNDTGATYRSCTGPGFPSISRLKQHLRRIHRAPIQCLRCWAVMANSEESSVHANQEIRCERQEPQPQGIDQGKMDLILSRHGATWAEIFEILFPGAPIPSPYFEASDLQKESDRAGSPESQELRDFGAYNRTALPLLVEANLQSIISAEMVPIEENVKKLLVDIVRSCLSTVAQNYKQLRGIRSSARNSTESSILSFAVEQQTDEASISTSQVPSRGTPQPRTLFFEEPPHIAVDTMPVTTALSHERISGPGQEVQYSDSGYGSYFDSCFCICHFHVDNDKVLDALGNCEDCSQHHNPNSSTHDFLPSSFDPDSSHSEPFLDPGDLLSERVRNGAEKPE